MKNLVILSGAGMSAESGISTFRDAGGLWDKYPVEQVATPEGYARNPERSLISITNVASSCSMWCRMPGIWALPTWRGISM